MVKEGPRMFSRREGRSSTVTKDFKTTDSPKADHKGVVKIPNGRQRRRVNN